MYEYLIKIIHLNFLVAKVKYNVVSRVCYCVCYLLNNLELPVSNLDINEHDVGCKLFFNREKSYYPYRASNIVGFQSIS